MEVWIFAGLMGIWFSALFLCIGILIGIGIDDKGNDNVNAQNLDERQPVLDSSSLSAVPSRDRDRSGNQSDNPQVDEVIDVLNTMRVGASSEEKAAIDYSKECIDIAHKLAEYWKGETE